GYEIPVTAWDTTVGGWFRYGTSDVIEQPFGGLDIRSKAKTVGIEVRQPVYRTLRNRVDLALTGEYRWSRTYLLGDPFPFEEGTDDGKVVVSVLRFRQDWLYRDLHQVVALRSKLSIGLDVLGATNNGCAFDATGICNESAGSGVPDAHFVAWLGQFQWVRRFDPWGIEAVFRTDLQVSSRPLFSLEQFSLGGHQTVRGYRENQLVRDNGLASSLELRLPVWSSPERGIEVQLAPFTDVGRSWNTDRPDSSPYALASVGVGLRVGWTRHLQGEIYWGHRLRHVEEPEHDDLQDEGVQFAVTPSHSAVREARLRHPAPRPDGAAAEDPPHAVRDPRPLGPAREPPVPRRDDVRRDGQPRPRRLRAHGPPRARRGDQLHRHRGRLLAGRVGGDRRRGARRAPRAGRARNEVLGPDGRRPEPARELAALDHPGGRGEPPPAPPPPAP